MTSTEQKRPRASRCNKAGHGAGIRFLRSLIGHKGSDCVMWPYGGCNGYGTFSLNGIIHAAHRYMCKMVHGSPPSQHHEAAHSCGRGHEGCVNPNHLSWKTTSENQLDRALHGTKNIWSSRGKLTPEKAEEIRALTGKQSQREIAKIFGVSWSQISWVMTGKSWAKERKGYYRRGNKWYARVKINRQSKTIGCFDTPEAAHDAYLAASSEIRRSITKGKGTEQCR